MQKNERYKRQNALVRIKYIIYALLINIILWTILLYLFVLLNYLIYPDIVNEGSKAVQLMYDNEWWSFAVALIIAFFTWMFEDVLFYEYLSKKSLGRYFVLRILFAVSFFIVLFFLVSFYHYYPTGISGVSEYFTLLNSFLFNTTALYFFLMGTFISAFINLFKMILRKVGTENFYKKILGYYRSPKEEDRIFIFIDLVSSTKFAELLGHQKYSSFLQDCFKELGVLEMKYRASLYQFVGDEVVLSWSNKNPKNVQNVVDFFFEFKAILASQSDIFMRKYGVLPEFYASINSGKIMVAEVGTLKSEIAYHGDVLNTAARIQKQCKNLNRELLVTGNFVKLFSLLEHNYKIEWMTNDPLVGKKRKVDIYAITSV